MFTLFLQLVLASAPFNAEDFFQANKSRLGPKMTEEDITHLTSPTSRSIRLPNKAIDQRTLDFIVSLLEQHNPSIEECYLSRNSITSLAPLNRLARLKILDISDNKIAVAGIAPILSSPTLEILDLSKTETDDVGVLQLVNYLQNNTTLQCLYLNDNQIGDTGIGFLLTRRFRELQLAMNRITDHGAELLTYHPTLGSLLISENPITIKGALLLAAHFKKLSEDPLFVDVDLKMNHLKVSKREIEAAKAKKENAYLDVLCNKGDAGRYNDKKTLYLLSIDGGGIRGIIPAMILDYIRLGLARSLGKDPASVYLSDCFNWFAGTSTGGLVSVGLVAHGEKSGPKGLNTNEIVEMYRTRGRHIFGAAKLGLFQSKYTAEGIEAVLAEYFGDKDLGNNTPPDKDVFLTSYDLQNACPRVFNSRLIKDGKEENVHIKTALRATAAAPTYLPGVHHTDSTGASHVYVDGGVYSNNPTGLALQYMKEHYLDTKQYDELFILSLGTGKPIDNIERAKLSEAGLLKWGVEISSFLFDTASQLVDETVRSIVATDARIKYKRIQTPIAPEEAAMADVSPEHLTQLSARVQQTINSHQHELNEIIAVLKESFETQA